MRVVVLKAESLGNAIDDALGVDRRLSCRGLPVTIGRSKKGQRKWFMADSEPQLSIIGGIPVLKVESRLGTCQMQPLLGVM